MNVKLRISGALGDVDVETWYHSDDVLGLLALVAGAELSPCWRPAWRLGSPRPTRVRTTRRCRRGCRAEGAPWLAGTQSWSLALLGTALGVQSPASCRWSPARRAWTTTWRCRARSALTLLVVPLLGRSGPRRATGPGSRWCIA